MQAPHQVIPQHLRSQCASSKVASTPWLAHVQQLLSLKHLSDAYSGQARGMRCEQRDTHTCTQERKYTGLPNKKRQQPSAQLEDFVSHCKRGQPQQRVPGSSKCHITTSSLWPAYNVPVLDASRMHRPPDRRIKSYRWKAMPCLWAGVMGLFLSS